MKERLFNLFLFVRGGIIYEIGAVTHDWAGPDALKMALLQSSATADLPNAKRYPVPDRYAVVSPEGATPRALGYETYLQLAAAGCETEFFEEVFRDLAAPERPLMCITPVVDGKVRIEEVRRL
jgi:hypothetical protein